MASSHNPVFNEKTFSRFAYSTGAVSTSRMTVRGTLDRASILFAIAVSAAAFSWVFVSTASALALPLAIGGGILAFVLALVVSFKPETAPFLSPVYAVAEGVLLGALSRLFEAFYPGIAMQAVLGTGVITGVMLLLYRSKVIRATPMLKKVVISMTLAVGLMYVIAFGIRMFGYQMPLLNDSGVYGIGLSLFLIGLAAFNLILDFDLIEQGEAQGAPKSFEWYGAFALLVTVAWIYFEVLRLLSKMRRE